MSSEKVNVNRTIERAQMIINAILGHLDNEKDCQHCKNLLYEVFGT